MSAIIHIKADDFNNEVLKSDRITIVDFYADWCEPCKYFLPVFERFANHHKHFKCVRINVDEAPGAVAKFGIKTIPTVVIFVHGKAIKGIQGSITKITFEKFIMEALKIDTL